MSDPNKSLLSEAEQLAQRNRLAAIDRQRVEANSKRIAKEHLREQRLAKAAALRQQRVQASLGHIGGDLGEPLGGEARGKREKKPALTSRELDAYVNKVTKLPGPAEGGVLTLDAFDEAIAMFGERVEQWGSQVYRAYCADLFIGVVRETPFKTGRARNNWQVGVNGIPGGKLPAQPDHARAELAKIEKARLHDDNIYIVNNLEYAPILEAGGSRQAPRGMVAVTVARVNAYYSPDMVEKIALGYASPLFGGTGNRGSPSSLAEAMERDIAFRKETFGNQYVTPASREYYRDYGNVPRAYKASRKNRSMSGEPLSPTGRETIGKQRAGKKGKVRQSHQKYDHYTLQDLLIDPVTGKSIPRAPQGPHERRNP
jgi:hypothetical protein